MSLAVLVYVDNKDDIIQEFTWLYKSILYSELRDEIRLVTACHPAALSKIPKDDIIICVPLQPYSEKHKQWQSYPFINSIASLCEEPVKEAVKGFTHVLKTDCDTFLTKYISGFRPQSLCFGNGEYAYDPEVRRNLERWADKIGFPHLGTHNVGASILGPTDKVMFFVQIHSQYCERLRLEEFTTNKGVWPGWFHGVLSMYAGELAQRAVSPQGYTIGLLDHYCHADRALGSEVLHIHAWHTSRYFSKHAFRRGEYDHISIKDIDRSNLGGYCHYLAKIGIPELLG